MQKGSCAGDLSRSAPIPDYRSKTELEGEPVIYRCGRCYTVYVGPPQGFLRDKRMESFVMAEQPEITPPEPKPPAHEAPKKDPATPRRSQCNPKLKLELKPNMWFEFKL